MGRHKKVDPRKLVRDIEDYLRTADPPIVAEFAHQSGITRQYLYQLAKTERDQGRPELAQALVKLSEAKEVKLEKGGLTGAYAPGMAIFSLKQLGWRDRPEVSLQLTQEDAPLTLEEKMSALQSLAEFLPGLDTKKEE